MSISISRVFFLNSYFGEKERAQRKNSLRSIDNLEPTLYRIHREREGRFSNLVLCVLVPVRQAGQASDAHDDNAIAGIKHYLRRCFRNPDIDTEALPHGIDGRYVR